MTSSIMDHGNIDYEDIDYENIDYIDFRPYFLTKILKRL